MDSRLWPGFCDIAWCLAYRRSWWKLLQEKMKDPEVKAVTYKSLIVIVEEEDKERSKLLFEKGVEGLVAGKQTHALGESFKKTYGTGVDQRAMSPRIGAGVNTTSPFRHSSTCWQLIWIGVYIGESTDWWQTFYALLKIRSLSIFQSWRWERVPSELVKSTRHTKTASSWNQSRSLPEALICGK